MAVRAVSGVVDHHAVKPMRPGQAKQEVPSIAPSVTFVVVQIAGRKPVVGVSLFPALPVHPLVELVPLRIDQCPNLRVADIGVVRVAQVQDRTRVQDKGASRGSTTRIPVRVCLVLGEEET